MSNNKLPFALAFERQYAEPLDPTDVFATIAERDAYLNNATRYPGQPVTCLEAPGKIFILSNDRSAWLTAGGDATPYKVFMTDEEMQAYLTDDARYAGQVVTCFEYASKLRMLNEDRTAWVVAGCDTEHTHDADQLFFNSGQYGNSLGENLTAMQGHERDMQDKLDLYPDPITNKLLVAKSDGTGYEHTSFAKEQILQTSAINTTVPGWMEQESRLVTVKKVNGEPQLDGAAELMDKSLPPGVLATLENSDANWVNESKTITGDNSSFALGRYGQTGWLSDRTFIECVAASDTSATFNRNRAVDVLNAQDAQDALVINQLDPSYTYPAMVVTGLSADLGWDLTSQTKLINNTTYPSKLGTWFVGGIGGNGYTYRCFSISGNIAYWKRDGQAEAIQRAITAASHPNLAAALLAHDFSTGRYTQTALEASYQDQTFEDTASRKYFVKVSATQWEYFPNMLPASQDSWVHTADNGNIVVQGAASVGTFTIKVKYKLYQSAAAKSVKLFPASMKAGKWVRFELCEYCRDTERAFTGLYPALVPFTINKFFDDQTPYAGSTGIVSNEAGAGYIYENGQDDSSRYFGSTVRASFNSITFTVDHNNLPSEGNTWIIVLLTGTIL